MSENKPTNEPEPTPTPTPTEPTPEPEVISLPKSAFNERLLQAERKGQRAYGMTPEEVKAQADELEALKREAEERRKAEMTEQERLKLESEEAKKRAEEAEAKAKAAEHRATVVELCAKHGVRDIEYAMFRIGRLEPGASIDEFLTETLKDDGEKMKFGISSKPVVVQSQDSTRTPNAAPPAPTTNDESHKPVSEMTKEEFAAYKRAKHGVS